MASNPPSQCCTIGVKHEGEPTGKMIKIAEKWDAYVAAPAPEHNEDKQTVGLLFLPDVIGIWANSKLMADQFAANGYLCVIPDIWNGDPMSLNQRGGLDWMKWLSGGSSGDNPHTPAAVDPIVEAAIQVLKEEYGITKIGAVGYCLGAKYVARHFKTGIEVGFMAHPAFVEEDELAGITGPLSIAAAETEVVFPAEKRHKSEEILARAGHPYQINLYSGVAHGFAVRCDPSKKIERFAREHAFLQAVRWFDAWLL